MWQIDQFSYTLPPERIAQMPAEPRDHSRLLVLDRQTGQILHRHFYDLPTFLTANDVLVRNNTKVLPARLIGQKSTGGFCELLLVKAISHSPAQVTWECMTKPGLKPGQELHFAGSDVTATCREITGYTRIMEFHISYNLFFQFLDNIGRTPIPPYIAWHEQDEPKLRQVYQTTYAKIVGSAAAPTAGLHFTPELDQKLLNQGVQIEEVTLHVGLGTFLPLQAEQLATGQLHHETYQVDEATAARITTAHAAGKRIIAVGTTSTRVLEACAVQTGAGTTVLAAGSGDTTLFIQPGYRFQLVDGMITNFHLPHSSLLMLISAVTSAPNTPHEFRTFAESNVGKAYAAAIAEQYRFFSFGDAMLIL